ncbi:MAG: ATP-binding protein [Geobacteraceae bacterium]|nr:ATP-binding protein [Geobacteraceae bacterium]
MQLSTLKEIIAGNRQFILNRAPAIIPRSGFVVPTGLNKVVVLYGVRRSGKTFILFDQCIRHGDAALYLDFEDDRLLGFNLSNFDLLKTAFLELYPGLIGTPPALFLDEVQNVEGWERFCRRAVEREGMAVFVSGSSSRMMPAEIHTELRGRAWSLEVMPYSFAEYVRSRGLDPTDPTLVFGKDRDRVRQLFGQYLRRGGYPEVCAVESDFDRMKLLKDYYGALYFRDLVERYQITNIPLLDALSDRLFSSFATRFTLSAFYKQYNGRFPLSKDLLFRYYRHFLESMLLYEVRLYAESSYARMRNPAKLYPVDTGLCRRVTSADDGRLLETVVFLELKRRGLELFYFHDKRECDFITRDAAGALQAIQVCHELTEENREREVGGLLDACRRIGADGGLLLTWGEEWLVEEAGVTISCLPVWKWCLETAGGI